MHRIGPTLESLTRRLAETPEEFLSEPKIGAAGDVHVAAVVNDLVRLFDGPLEVLELSRFESNDPRTDRNRLSVTLLICWLLADDWFRETPIEPTTLKSLLSQGTAELAEQVAARKFVTDPDRREEMARFALSNLGFRPTGESVEQAQDRLTSLSSTERTRVLRAAREAEKRARSIREALARKAAEESADKWTRE